MLKVLHCHGRASHLDALLLFVDLKAGGGFFATWTGEGDLHRGLAGAARQNQRHVENPGSGIGAQSHVLHVNLASVFQPDGLPDPGGWRVHYRFWPGDISLFAPGDAGVRGIVYRQDQILHALAQVTGDIISERRIAARVDAERLAVYPDLGHVIHRPETQQHPARVKVLRYMKPAAVPHHRETGLFAHATQGAFRAIGNIDCVPKHGRISGKTAPFTLSPWVQVKTPGAAQIQEPGPGKIRPGNFFEECQKGFVHGAILVPGEIAMPLIIHEPGIEMTEVSGCCEQVGELP